MIRIAALGALVALAAGAASPASAAAPSARAEELARRIVMTQAGAPDVAAVAAMMSPVVVMGLSSRLPPDRRADTRELEAAVNAEVPAFVGRMVDFSAGQYAAEFTETQLQDAVSTPDSVAAQAVAAREAEIDARMASTPALQPVALVTAIVDRYCARTACPADLRAALIAPAPRR